MATPKKTDKKTRKQLAEEASAKIREEAEEEKKKIEELKKVGWIDIYLTSGKFIRKRGCWKSEIDALSKMAGNDQLKSITIGHAELPDSVIINWNNCTHLHATPGTDPEPEDEKSEVEKEREETGIKIVPLKEEEEEKVVDLTLEVVPPSTQDYTDAQKRVEELD